MLIDFKKENKKAGIVTFGPRLTLSSNNVRSIDAEFLRRFLIDVYQRKSVDLISGKTKKEENCDYYKDILDTDFNSYDEIFIYNSSFNPFGGIFKDFQLELLKKLNSCNKNINIYYFQTDSKMPILDYAKFLKARSKNNIYEYKCTLHKENILSTYKFTQEELDYFSVNIYPRIHPFMACENYDLYYKEYTLKIKNSKTYWKQLNPNYEWICINDFYSYAASLWFDGIKHNYNKQSIYDFVYYGNNRNNERNTIIKKFLSHKDLKTLSLGYNYNIKNCDYHKPMLYFDLFKYINENCYSCLVIGDKLHYNNFMSLRFFESLANDIIAFMYLPYDENKIFIDDKELKQFIYVSNVNELVEKIKILKKDKRIYQYIMELESNEIKNKIIKFKQKHNLL